MVFGSMGIVGEKNDFIDIKASAASTYDPEKAIAYAAANWNNGVGLCAEFVSNCLTAGGVSIMQKKVSGLESALRTGGYGTLCKLNSSATQWGQVAKMSDNQGKVKVGDPLFTYCSVCGYTHAVICGGVDSSGYITIYAHNSAKNNKKYYADCTSHSASYISIYSFSMNTHTHNYTTYVAGGAATCETQGYTTKSCSCGQTITTYSPAKGHDFSVFSHYEESHPHYKVYRCSRCSKTQKTNETSFGTSCVQCNPSAFCVDLGSNFYGLILNNAIWKPISKSEGTNDISLQTENGNTMQRWRFWRHSDGSYSIISCYDKTVLEMTDGIRAGGTTITAKNSVTDGNWKNDYQKWYIIPQGNGYVFINKHYASEQWAMDLSGNNSNDGTNIIIYERNNSAAQIWSIYAGNEVQLSPTTLNVNVNSAKATFTWNTYSAHRFDLKIYPEAGTGMLAENVKNGYSIELPEGKYTAQVISYDSFLSVTSEAVEFEINDENYALSYNANGGTGAPATQNGSTSYVVPRTEPVKDGYTFIGWAESTAVRTPDYVPGDRVTLTQNTTLYAVWEKNREQADELTCSKCGAVFESEAELNEHIASCDADGSSSGGGFFSFLFNIFYFIIGLVFLPFLLIF